VIHRPSDLRASVVTGLGREGAGKNEPGISRCRAIPLRQAWVCCGSPPVVRALEGRASITCLDRQGHVTARASDSQITG